MRSMNDRFWGLRGRSWLALTVLVALVGTVALATGTLTKTVGPFVRSHAVVRGHDNSDEP